MNAEQIACQLYRSYYWFDYYQSKASHPATKADIEAYCMRNYDDYACDGNPWKDEEVALRIKNEYLCEMREEASDIDDYIAMYREGKERTDELDAFAERWDAYRDECERSFINH